MKSSDVNWNIFKSIADEDDILIEDIDIIKSVANKDMKDELENDEYLKRTLLKNKILGSFDSYRMGHLEERSWWKQTILLLVTNNLYIRNFMIKRLFTSIG